MQQKPHSLDLWLAAQDSEWTWKKQEQLLTGESQPREKKSNNC